jgi:DNA-binding GntR family transcriptional regulator
MPRAPSQVDRVYAQLRLALLRGDLPETEALVEHGLAHRFETSRTPVREALRRLEGDGHLVRDGSGRLRPSVPSVDSMPDLYEVRLALEEITVRRAAAAHGVEALEEVHRLWLALQAAPSHPPDPDFVRTDEELHEAIAAAAGNAVAQRTLRDINRRIRVVRMHEFTSEERIRATIAEHLEILGAIRAGEVEAAVDYMRAHVQRAALVARQRIGDAAQRMRATSGDGT